MSESIVIAKSNGKDLAILANFANRHGLITGATGTGKTVTLQKIAESFSKIGVPVFLADVKGDLTGIGEPGTLSEKLQARLNNIGVKDWQPNASPVELWDVFAEKGLPVRSTVSDIGPILLARLLNLNDTQAGVLQLVFKIADDNNLQLLDFKDLRALVQFVGDNAKKFTTEYGNISSASIGAIQRSLLTLDQQGAEYFLGEPMLDIQDLLRVNNNGQGVVNILAADKLYNSPKLYSVFLLWLLSELFEHLPEIGDPDKPKLVFFFDEAHLLFNDISPALLQKIEQVVRLIRSKGVGVYFVTQNPTDIPDTILGQLGNRVQHALRAFTPKDQKAIKAAAQTMRSNPSFDAETAIMELAVGEALISFLDEKGRPNMVERGFVIAPNSHMGPMAPEKQNAIINQSHFYNKYADTVDRESAYEKLKAGFSLDTAANSTSNNQSDSQNGSSGGWMDVLSSLFFGSKGPKGGQHDGLAQKVAKSATRQVVNELGKRITRGILGGFKR
ncbi:helicase HerA-like C-terminal domain-containing protein [Gilliamella sp. wkB112]|uniref:helicase HerA-like C-terminal domain-containing protein n=1 Tax=Gilliamella sp. wkB112 TaxID=3120257 RepID=UPI00080E7447|nr:helicase HerA-like C-terminal domain-containing protein [Gilliamella apicola]OCG03006.1 ATP-binding protein [Gilliamella apicola]